MQQLKQYLKYYLDTGLKFQRDEGTMTYQIREFDVIHGNHVYLDEYGFNNSDRDRSMKPLMRPLSDLTKEIVVENYNDGKPFVPMEEIKDQHPNIPNWEYITSLDHVLEYQIKNDLQKSNIEWCVMEKLISWGFWIGSQDYFDKGLIKEI